MNKYLFGLFLIAISHFGSAQNNQNLFRIVEEGRFGFIDAKGKVVIPSRFRYVGDFCNGLAAAKLDSGYGFINQKGQFVIKPIYDFADDFIDTSAFVVLNQKQYFVNKNGRTSKFSIEKYELIKTNHVNTYASCDQSEIIITEIRHYGGLQIINRNISDTIFTFFDEVEDTYTEYFGDYEHPQFGFKKEIMLVVKEGQLCYVDTNGAVVWQAKSLHEKKLHKLNLEFRTALKTNCVMFPSRMEKLESNLFKLDTNQLVVKAFPDELAPLSNNIIGMKVRLINNLPYPDDTISIRDPFLFWNLEMKTVGGKWIPMESRCGGRCVSIFRPKYQNIDTLIKLPPKHYFTFNLPTYDGTHSATFRYCFEGSPGKFYTQEFEGKYNPAQLYNTGVKYTGSVLESVFGMMKLSQDYRFNYFETFIGCSTLISKWECFE